MNLPENVLKRLQDLFSLARSEDVNEAATAAAIAQRICAKYRVDAALIAAESQSPEEAVETSEFFEANRLSTWRKAIAAALLRANGCECFAARKRGKGVTVMAVGRPSDVATVKYLYESLCNQVEWLVQECRKNGKISGSKQSNDFRLGASAILKQRIDRESLQTRQQLRDDPRYKQAMIRLDAVEVAVRNKMPGGLKREAAPRQRSLDANAFALGVKAGQEVVLENGIRRGLPSKGGK